MPRTPTFFTLIIFCFFFSDCDPHPGNLLRTTDGKLCILDWGMTLEVPPDLQYALLELIAHINVEDYDSIPQDFINLGFSPDGVTAERLKESGITEGLTFAFRQLSQGGGPKKIQERVKAEFQERYGSSLTDQELQEAARTEMIQRMEAQLEAEGVDVKGVTNVMEEMSKRNRELFQLPPYVLYVARAFSTLEGIGLSIDDNYSIVQECYPYLARRLFTDRSPRAKRALKAMLGLSETDDEDTAVPDTHYDKNGASSSPALAMVQAGTRQAATTPSTRRSTGSLSPRKLMEMSDGFASYTAATAQVDRDGAGQAAAASEFAKLLLDPKGSTLQDILVEETAKFGDAATRAALRASFVDSAPAKAAAMAFQSQKQWVDNSPLVNFFPAPLKSVLVDSPAEFPELIKALLSTSPEDDKILTTATELRDVLSSRLLNGDDTKNARKWSNNEQDRETIRALLSNKKTRDLILEQVPGVATLGRRVGAGLLRRAAYRTDRSQGLPEELRKRLAETNRRLAKAVDVSEDKS
jgi:aarF domain-containing kinase